MDCNVCRGCMSTNVKVFHLAVKGVKDVFEECTRLVLEQQKSLPLHLCQTCLTKCNEWKKFQTKCKETEQKLINICTGNMDDDNNIEISDSDDENQSEPEHLPIEVILHDYPVENTPFEDIETPIENKRKIPPPFKITVQPIETKLSNKGKINLIPKTAEKSLSTIFKCKICKQTFKTISVYENHYTIAHLDREALCMICDNKFKGEENLLLHQIQFHTVPVLRSVDYCRECKTNFPTKLEYTEHQNLKCDRSNCERAFCQNDNLMDHYVRIHGDINQKFPCPQCDKTVGSKSSLQAHLKSHLNLRTFCCYKCGKMFARNSGLQRHLEEFHDTVTDPHVYHCHVCPKTFKNLSNLRSHFNGQHKSDTTYSCEICSKTFKHKPTYRRHKMMHDNIRPFECSICGQRFIQKSAMKPHMKRHEEVMT